MNSHWTALNTTEFSYRIWSYPIFLPKPKRADWLSVSGFCDEYLWVYFDLSVEIWWVHMSMYYGGVVQNSVRNISPLDSIAFTHVAIWHLFIIMKSMTEFSTSQNTCSMPFPTHTRWLFFLPGLFWTEPRRTLVRNSAHSDLGLNQCLLVVKARLKPAYN